MQINLYLNAMNPIINIRSHDITPITSHDITSHDNATIISLQMSLRHHMALPDITKINSLQI